MAKRTIGKKKTPPSNRPFVACVHCGAQHQRKGDYCSDACKQAAYRERNKAKETTNRDVTVTVESERNYTQLPEAISEHLDRLDAALESLPTVTSEASQQFQEMLEAFAKDFQSYFEVKMPQQISYAVHQAIGGLQVTAFTGVQISAPQLQPNRLPILEDEPEIAQTKIKVDGRDYANNFLKAISGASGVNFIAPPETRQPERTIRINGEDVAAPKGIRKMDVPVLAAPNFDDDDDDLPLM
jgi:predicted nucleic acid-binding Zn ribbon protein